MAVQEDYITGTVSITQGTKNLVGVGSGWDTWGFERGDLFFAGGYVGVIDTVNSNTSITLYHNFPVTLAATTYRMRFMGDADRTAGKTRQLIALLEDGGFFHYDAVGTLAERAQYDLQIKGFAFLDITTIPFNIYVKASNTSGDWAGPSRYMQGEQGIQGEKGWSPQLVAEVDGERRVFKLSGYVGGEGSAPTANIGQYLKSDGTWTAVKASAADFRGESILSKGNYSAVTAYVRGNYVQESGSSWVLTAATSTGNAPPTLPTTSNAYWQLLARRGIDSAIEGVTPFWNTRLGADADAAAARTGLGAVGGPGASVANRVAQFDGTTGKLLKDSGSLIQTSKIDTTDGSLIGVGSFGIGRGLSSSATDLNDTTIPSGTFYFGAAPTNGPPGGNAGWLDNDNHPTSPTLWRHQTWNDLTDGWIATRSMFNGVWGVWQRQHDSLHRIINTVQPTWSAARPGTNKTTVGVIDWGSARVNQGGHFNTGTNVFTCPVAGRYLVMFHNLVFYSVSSTPTQVMIRRNGTNIIQIYQDAGYGSAGGQYNMGSGMGILDCAANDTIDFYLAIAGMVYSSTPCNGTIALLN